MWALLAKQKDAAYRPLFPGLNPLNAVGTTSLKDPDSGQIMDLSYGIVPSWSGKVAVMGVRVALRTMSGPVSTMDADVPENLSRVHAVDKHAAFGAVDTAGLVKIIDSDQHHFRFSRPRKRDHHGQRDMRLHAVQRHDRRLLPRGRPARRRVHRRRRHHRRRSRRRQGRRRRPDLDRRPRDPAVDAASGEATAAALDDTNTNFDAVETKINAIIAALEASGLTVVTP